VLEEAGLHSSNPYQDADGGPLLRNSVVAWLDILGFEGSITEARAHGTELQLVETLAHALKRLVAELRPAAARAGVEYPPAWVVKGFTDNFVVGFPLRPRAAEMSTEGEIELGMIVGRIGQFQLAFALEGFFLRGGITIGPLYMDENLVYGSALIEAIEAEKRRARDPRVILTESARAVIDETNARWPEELTPDAAFLWQDSDGEVFVNYLSEICEFETDMGYPDVDTLCRHGDVVRKKLAAYQQQPWGPKYEWVARYHNAFLESRPDFPEQSRIVGQSGGSFKVPLRVA
jgi:hypothetical protein